MIYAKINIDPAKADNILGMALKIASQKNYIPRSREATDIASIILGSHLTYRYILVTNLLAKATDSRANGLSLQAGAEIDGAFDSRSLCHKILVPFERRYLANRLGGSNEPYLNKPARNTMLAATNPVRSGSDTVLLQTCIKILSRVAAPVDALTDALYYTLQRTTLAASSAITREQSEASSIALAFARGVLAQKTDGEGAALISALAFYCYAVGMRKQVSIRLHPVNQAGSSSNEVLDIDVYEAEKLAFTAEVKDKTFSEDDVDHAAKKAVAAGCESFFFLKGTFGLSQVAHESAIQEAMLKKHGVHVTFLAVIDFFAAGLGFAASCIDSASIWSVICNFGTAARFKDDTKEAILRVASHTGLIEA